MRRARPAVLGLAGLAALACSEGGGSPTVETPPPAPMAAPQPLSASYTVTFDATWSRRTHPVEAPDNPHFSPLVGGTHDARARFWSPGALASRGIENMAELGATSPLDDEIERAVAAGTAELVLRGAAIGRSPGRAAIDFVVSQAKSRVTLVTMVAPSPDWFVGVDALDLFEGGVWADEVVVPLLAWDAGTDEGRTFTSPDDDAVPARPITLITSSPLAPQGNATPLGTFTFKRVG
jgi:hypothetical protein